MMYFTYHARYMWTSDLQKILDKHPPVQYFEDFRRGLRHSGLHGWWPLKQRENGRWSKTMGVDLGEKHVSWFLVLKYRSLVLHLPVHFSVASLDPWNLGWIASWTLSGHMLNGISTVLIVETDPFSIRQLFIDSCCQMKSISMSMVQLTLFVSFPHLPHFQIRDLSPFSGGFCGITEARLSSKILASCIQIDGNSTWKHCKTL